MTIITPSPPPPRSIGEAPATGSEGKTLLNNGLANPVPTIRFRGLGRANSLEMVHSSLAPRSWSGTQDRTRRIWGWNHGNGNGIGNGIGNRECLSPRGHPFDRTTEFSSHRTHLRSRRAYPTQFRPMLSPAHTLYLNAVPDGEPHNLRRERLGGVAQRQ